MYRSPLLNGPLSAALADLAHGDEIVLTGAALPRPDVLPSIDLSLVAGNPTVVEVLDALLPTFPVEYGLAAHEVLHDCPSIAADLSDRLPHLDTIPHADLMTRSHRAKVVVRTGDDERYANVILRRGF
ncbi:RbsD/FucU domain-containing protein [Streptomyces sp. Da 82-17]|uniref:RbsD/FucU domain-containing protein n=1 Tax=Streptomyces sp. Da 82-17 TaxID=3377116 RepID=UPI0038D51347